MPTSGGGFTRNNPNNYNYQWVSITSIDATSRMAVGLTRAGTSVRIDIGHSVGAVLTTPNLGDQWNVVRQNGIWILQNKLKGHDPNQLTQATQGQQVFGSGSGPVELNGNQVNVNAPAMRIGTTLYRDSAGTLQNSVDGGVTWHAVTGGGGGGSGTMVYGEVPTGTIDGVNATFTTANSFAASATGVYRNGLREVLGVGYTESGSATIVFSTPPIIGDEITVDYTEL